ncbi:MAG TPA: anti-sigma factor [Aestuariivirgaceae bacterium]|nr:anti-sigma factor [Aestuariivirgaceae bacterium]
MTTPLTKHDWVLHAYVDGELELSEKMLVEKDLNSDHEARTSIESWRRQNEALKQAFARVMNEQLPPGIKAALNTRSITLRRWYLPAAAAAVLAILAGSYVIYSDLVGFSTAGARAFAENALSAHVVYSTEVRHPVEVSAAEKDHLDSWLSKRLGHKINAPDLSSRGFDLIGGRLLHEDRKPAAQFMYEDARKHRLTVYVGNNPTNRETAFRMEENSGYTTCYWLDEDAGYAVAGEIEPDEMLPLGMFIYDVLKKAEEG